MSWVGSGHETTPQLSHSPGSHDLLYNFHILLNYILEMQILHRSIFNFKAMDITYHVTIYFMQQFHSRNVAVNPPPEKTHIQEMILHWICTNVAFVHVLQIAIYRFSLYFHHRRCVCVCRFSVAPLSSKENGTVGDENLLKKCASCLLVGRIALPIQSSHAVVSSLHLHPCAQCSSKAE